MKPKSIAAAVAVTSALAMSACSRAVDIPDQTQQQRDIDAESYYEDYRSPAIMDTQTGGVRGGPAVSTLEEGEEPGLLEDNTFVDAGTSGFVDAGTDPLSTFALEVDTGSFSVGRALLTAGVLPPPASIRPEEWVNAFDYHQPPPTDSDLGVQVDQMPVPGSTDGTQLVRVGIKAREIADAERDPVALTLVADTSGSMDTRERLGLVKSSLALLAQHLRPTDTVAVITYEDSARPLLEPTPVSETDTILDTIDRLRPGGSTNLAAGLRLGYRQAQAAYRPDAINAVILASDGVANVGTTGRDSLAQMISEGGNDGIHLVTVGYGMGNYNDDLMEQLADQGDGFYAYVDTFAEAEQLYAKDLTGTLTTVAKDAKVQVAFEPGLVTSYRLIGYDNRALADDEFTDDDVDAGEVGAGHDVTALYEVRLADRIEPGMQIGEVTVRWESPDSGAIEEQTSLIETVSSDAPTSGELMLAAAVADLAQLLKESPQLKGRELDLGSLGQRAAELQQRGVDGADELSTLIAQAGTAR